jgi:hypothetical protein
MTLVTFRPTPNRDKTVLDKQGLNGALEDQWDSEYAALSRSEAVARALGRIP